MFLGKHHTEQEMFSGVADSGASLSYVSRETINRLKTTTEAFVGPKVLLADGTINETTERVNLMVRIGPVQCAFTFAVLPSLPADCLLGLDFLTLYEIAVMPSRGGLEFLAFPGMSLKFITSAVADEQVLCCARDMIIPARSEVWVETEALGPSTELMLTEPIADAEIAKGLLGGRTLSEGPPAHVLFANLGCKAKVVRKGSRLATCQKVSASEVYPQPHSPKCAPKGYQLPPDVVMGEQLTSDQVKVMADLLLQMGPNLFSSEDRPFGKTNLGYHSVETGDNAPIAQGVRPTAPADRAVVREEVQKMLESGAIRHSKSPWASPIVLVRKKDGSVRFCVDYRRLNDITKKDVTPLPRTSDMLESLAGAKIFTTLDAAAGYWHLPMRATDIEKTAFICSEGLFEFTVMPFGLCNAPATYQRLMNLLLAGLTWQSCLVYIDDILVYSPDFKTHVEDLSRVLTRLSEAGFVLKAKKCRFGVERVEYLGHIVTPEGISPDPSKIDKLMRFPTPRNTTEVRAFLGLAGYYRKFIRDFADTATPLFDLLKNDTAFLWGEAQEQSLRKLTLALTKEAVLRHPRFDLPWIVDADASDQGLGACLSQVVNGLERPVAFASRRLQPAESKWHIREKEALGIVWALETYRHYLLGSKFIVRTDHSSLQWLKNAKSGRLCRWALRLAEFGDFEIVHRSGKSHANVDAFTRSFAESEAMPENAFCTLAIPKIRRELPSREEMIAAQAECPRCTLLRLRRQDHIMVRDGVLGTKEEPFKPFLPDSLFTQVVRALHEPAHHAHLGAKKTWSKVSSLFEVNNGLRKVETELKSCLACNQRKPPLPKHGKLASVPPSAPWDTVAVDFCGPYVTSECGNRFILVFADHFTKYVELIPTSDQSAKTVCEAFYQNVLCRHGTPARLLSDQGPQFKSELVEGLCGTFGIHKIFSSTYYPQGDGLAERFMRTMNNSLSILSREHQRDWDSFVAGVQFAYNSSVHASTGFAPFVLTSGRIPSFPEAGWLNSRQKSTTPEYLRTLCATITRVHQEASAALEKSYADLKRRYDAKRRDIQLQVGTSVLVRLSDYERNQSECRKLAPRWSEPAEVIACLSNHKTYRVRHKDGQEVTVNVARILPIGPALWTSEALKGDPQEKPSCPLRKLVELTSDEEDTDPDQVHGMPQLNSRLWVPGASHDGDDQVHLVPATAPGGESLTSGTASASEVEVSVSATKSSAPQAENSSQGQTSTETREHGSDETFPSRSLSTWSK